MGVAKLTHSQEWREKWKPPIVVHGQTTPWGWTVLYPEHLRISRYVDIGCFTLINALGTVILEEDVEIGSHCGIHSYSTINNKRGPITLKKNCKIGSGCFIMPNVIVGENSIVGSGIYLDKDVPPDTVIIPQQKLIYMRRPSRT